MRLVVNSVWSPSVETATQVSRWFDIDCSAQTSTILLCLILIDLDIMWFIAWRAICTHALGHPRARTWTWMYDPTGPLVGVYNVFSRSKHCTVDVLGGFSAIPAGLIIHSRLWEALVSATSPHILCLALTAEARLLRRDQGAEKHGYFWRKKSDAVLLSDFQGGSETVRDCAWPTSILKY